MPALPSVPKVIKMVTRFTRGEDVDVLNIFHIQYTGTPPTNTDLSLFNIAAGGTWATHMSGDYGSNIELTQIESTDLSSPTSSQSTDAVSHTGGLGGAALPAATSFVLQQRISRRYRGGHPRLYLVAGDETKLQDVQTWKAAFVIGVPTDFAAWMLDLFTNVWSGGGALANVSVSYFQGFTNHTYPSGRVRAVPNVRATPLIDTVQSFEGAVHIGSQRRRNLSGS